jgi:two-component system response regulator FixJ
VALLQVLSERDPDLPVVMLTAHGDIPVAVDALKTVAVEFLEKPADTDDLCRKVAHALARSFDLQSDYNERGEIRTCLATLTTRENQVLNYLVDGKLSQTIAEIPGSSHNTVRVQRTSIMNKMRADNIADLVSMMNRINQLQHLCHLQTIIKDVLQIPGLVRLFEAFPNVFAATAH